VRNPATTLRKTAESSENMANQPASIRPAFNDFQSGWTFCHPHPVDKPIGFVRRLFTHGSPTHKQATVADLKVQVGTEEFEVPSHPGDDFVR